LTVNISEMATDTAIVTTEGDLFAIAKFLLRKSRFHVRILATDRQTDGQTDNSQTNRWTALTH